MTRYLLLYTEPPTRRVLAEHRPGRLIFASDCVTPEDRAVYDECIPLPPVWEIQETLLRLGRVKADRIIVQSEYGLLVGSILASPGPRAAFLCVNKWLGRQALRQAGVPVPRFALVSSAREILRLDLRWPIVLKPVASTLGRLVRKVETPSELEAAVAELRVRLPNAPDVLRCLNFARLMNFDMDCDAARQFLVEEFVEGPPRETDGLIFGDRIVCFGTTDQVVGGAPNFYIEGYKFPVEADLERVTERALRALGLQDAGFSIEFRGGTVIEVNGRLGEDAGFPDLFHAALGQYPILKWMQGDAGAVRPGRFAAVAYRSRYAPGTVRRIANANGAVVLVEPGQRLPAPHTEEFNPHLAYALATSSESAEAAYRSARRAVDQVEFEIE